jgi:aspartate aminotransferase-like enzyme
MERRGVTLSAGYGKIKEMTFRVAHMGETTLEELENLLRTIDEELPRL